jgi:hypothetical protein
MLVAFNAATILFPSGQARLSTILMLAAFFTLAIARGSWLPVLACAGWLAGFEAALNIAEESVHHHRSIDDIHFVVYLALSIFTLFWLAHRHAGPSWNSSPRPPQFGPYGSPPASMSIRTHSFGSIRSAKPATRRPKPYGRSHI